MKIYEEVTVWCAILAFGIIGFLFFEENGLTVTVTDVAILLATSLKLGRQ